MTSLWEFAPTNGGSVTGFNDPTVSNFKGKPYYYLAREPIQNIIDNKLPNDLPALVTYELINIRASELPKIKEFKEILIKCKKYNEGQTDCVNFLDKAVKKIEKNVNIPILKISDYNTTGLFGDEDDKKGSYWKFAKAVGYSASEGSGGGSWGLGKGSYYAASNFRTIFFSSVYDKSKVVFQGKSFLPSHEDNVVRQGNGSFGFPGQKAVRSREDIPEQFRREKQGTDFYILDYNGSLNWEKEIITSVLDNFWPAIHEGILQVKVGKESINKDNLYESYLTKYFSLYDPPDSDNKPNPLPYYFAYTQKSKGRVFESDLINLGKVKLSLCFDPSFKKKVIYIRNTGMVIQKKGEGFFKGFAGVFSCLNKEGSFILRKMENQQHNQWRKENAADTEFYQIASVVEIEIRKFILDCFKQLSEDFSQSETIPGLEDYFASKDDLSLGNLGVNEGIAEEESAVEKAKEDETKSPTVFKKIKISKTVQTTGLESGTEPSTGGEGKGGENGKEGGAEGKGDRVIFTSCIFRSFAYHDKAYGTVHKIIIKKGPPLQRCSIEIKAGTDTVFENIPVDKVLGFDTKDYQIEGNFIKGLRFDQSGMLSLDIDFQDEEKYSLNVTAYADK